MRFAEIGQQLRAYRLESGLRAEEIAARLGVSRAALYRYEKGEVIKLDTVKRLGELLKVSPLSLLGIGVEYYSRSVGYFERVRQIEETAEQVLQACVGYCYLTTSDQFDNVLASALAELAEASGADRPNLSTTADQIMGLLAARRGATSSGVSTSSPSCRARACGRSWHRAFWPTRRFRTLCARSAAKQRRRKW